MTEQDMGFTGATGSVCASPLFVCEQQKPAPSISVGFAFLFLLHRRLTGKKKTYMCVSGTIYTEM